MAAFPFPGWQTSANGTTLASGAKIDFYVPGTARGTRRTPFTDEGLTVPTTNPVILNSSGWPSTNIYLDTSLAYEYEVVSADGATVYVPLTVIPAGGTSGNQPVDATLTAIAGLTFANGEFLQATGVDTFRTVKMFCDTIAELRAIGSSDRFDDMPVLVFGRTVAGDWGRPVVWRFDASNLSTQVAADEVTTSEGDGGRYIAPGDAKTGSSGAWKAEHGGVILFQHYGAKGDFNYTTETGTDCYAAVQTLLDNAIEGETITALPGKYRFTDTLTFTNKHLKWRLMAGATPLIFEDCDGILADNSSDGAARSQTVFDSVMVLTTVSGTRTGIEYRGARLTAATPDDVKFINCHAYGVERIAQRKWSTNSGTIYDTLDWGVGLHTKDCDGVVFEDCSIVGREGQATTNYSGVTTYGVITEDCVSPEHRNPEYVNCTFPLHVKGQTEATKTFGGGLIGKWSLTFDVDDPANDLTMTGTHMAATQGYVDFATKATTTGTAGFSAIHAGLLLQIGAQSNFIAFKNIGPYTTISDMRLLGSGGRTDHTTFNFPSGTTDCKIHNNFIRHGGVVFDFDSGSENNVCLQNVTADDADNVALALVSDSGTNNVVHSPHGFRKAIHSYHRGALMTLEAATLSIPEATFTLVTFDNEVYDTDGIAPTSGTTMTIPAALNGKRVKVTAKVAWSSFDGGDRIAIILYNGAALYPGAAVDGTVSDAAGTLFRTVQTANILVSTGNTFQLQVSQSTGGALNLLGEGRMWMQLDVIE